MGYALGRGTTGGPFMDLSSTVYGLLIGLAAVETFRHGRARRWPAHRRWGLRLSVLVIASWLYRMHYVIWDLVADGAVTPTRLVTHRFPIDAGLSAYEALQSEEERPLGLLLSYPNASSRATDETLQRKIPLRSVTAAARAPSSLRWGVLGAGGYAKGVLLPELAKMADAQLVTLCATSGASALI